MRILLIGATGTIGRAIAAALTSHDVLLASHSKAPFRVDIADPASIRALYGEVGTVDAIISAAGPARFKPLDTLSDDDFLFSIVLFSIQNKLMCQVNVVR